MCSLVDHIEYSMCVCVALCAEYTTYISACPRLCLYGGTSSLNILTELYSPMGTFRLNLWFLWFSPLAKETQRERISVCKAVKKKEKREIERLGGVELHCH